MVRTLTLDPPFGTARLQHSYRTSRNATPHRASSDAPQARGVLDLGDADLPFTLELLRLESLTRELGEDEAGTGIDGAAHMVEAISVAKLAALRRRRPVRMRLDVRRPRFELVLPGRRLTGRKAIEAWLTGK